MFVYSAHKFQRDRLTFLLCRCWVMFFFFMMITDFANKMFPMYALKIIQLLFTMVFLLMHLGEPILRIVIRSQ